MASLDSEKMYERKKKHYPSLLYRTESLTHLFILVMCVAYEPQITE